MVDQYIYQHNLIPPGLECQILSFLRAEWPEDIAQDPTRRHRIAAPEHHPVSLVLVDSGCVVSHALVLWKYLEHMGETYKVYGLASVFTYPDYRGKGYGKQIVAAGTALIRNSDADVAMLFCLPRLKDFYVRSGWIPTEHSATLKGTKDQLVFSGQPRLMLFLSEKGQRGRYAFEHDTVDFGEMLTW